MRRKRTACVDTFRSGATLRLANRDRTAEAAVRPCRRVFRTLITLTGTVARERVPCQRQRRARERPTPPVRRVPDSLSVEDSEMCREMCLACRDVPRCAETYTHIEFGGRWNIGNVRDSPHVPEIRPRVPRFASRAEIRVAKTPSDDEPFHTFFSLSPSKRLPFFGTLIEIYIYLHIVLLFNTPRYFGRRPPNSICVYF